MARISPDKIITSIDVGTTKICVLIAHQLDDNTVDVIGVGRAPSDGLHKGVVADIAKTIRSIKAAVQEAELAAGISVNSASIGIAGGHIQSMNSQGLVAVERGEIKQTDIDDALAAAKAIPIPEGMQILHVLPQYFIIDGRDRVSDPHGRHGIRLEVQAHIILGAIASVQDLVKCCQQAGILVEDVVLEPLASAHAVLSPDELQLGVGVLDIGGGTSDLALYQKGSIRHTMVLPVAGNHFTNDVAVGLRVKVQEAERIKKAYGRVDRKDIASDEIIEVEMVQGGQMRRSTIHELVRILRPRAQEVLTLVHHDIAERHLKSVMSTGLVLTGGGSLLAGMPELAEEIFKLPVRIGKPYMQGALPEMLNSPMYATGYGLLLYAMQKKKQNKLSSLEGPMVKRVFERMKSWVLDFF